MQECENVLPQSAYSDTASVSSSPITKRPICPEQTNSTLTAISGF